MAEARRDDQAQGEPLDRLRSGTRLRERQRDDDRAFPGERVQDADSDPGELHPGGDGLLVPEARTVRRPNVLGAGTGRRDRGRPLVSGDPRLDALGRALALVLGILLFYRLRFSPDHSPAHGGWRALHRIPGLLLHLRLPGVPATPSSGLEPVRLSRSTPPAHAADAGVGHMRIS